ncbi:carboxymuconolactone decarboxylase family protein [Desulfoluna spongiiphila]|uniref:carboxymuconolactone decarboxylase family protein n=1 Tax=Desulfoluna spongiiphila TaxID=419481 RepID=UPI00125FA77D|nr:carboxymuconolactone decarboxylase family protein [Desulfoluna spongiiphila]
MWQLFETTKNEMPSLVEAYYGPVKDAVYTDGSLDSKTKRLMSLAVAVQAGCKDCIISQTSKALELGATPAEIFETCSVAISMGGTLAWSQVLVVADYLREKEIIQ